MSRSFLERPAARALALTIACAALVCFAFFAIAMHAAAASEQASGSAAEAAASSEGEEVTSVQGPAASEESATFPEELAEVPDSYFEEAQSQGTLEDLYYDTYESFSYADKTTPLTKHAVVYLPAGYSEDGQYNVVYLMHGGWSNETTYLGTPGNPSVFKNVLDNAIAAGEIEPIIVVCPTYNNTSAQDSSDYSLALQLTSNYPQELVSDLMPAVEGTYATFAETTDPAGLAASRDHRAFAGFSMGSVQTWHVFEQCLDYFRYFLPSSGALTSDGEYMADIVRNSGHAWDDFFIFACSGTDDFAYSAFTSQINAMEAVSDGTFRLADNERDGNLWYAVQPGGTHNAEYAEQYFYNGLRCLWHGEAASGSAVADAASADPADSGDFTLDTTVEQVESDPAFEGFGELLFPVDRSVDPSMTLEQVTSPSVYVWYSDLQPQETVDVLNYLKGQVLAGNQIFYRIYSDEEIAADPSKADTGLFFFRGEQGAPYAIMNAGGGFMYVGAMHDSFPQALAASERGYNAFALIYRPDDPYNDLARAIEFVNDHADELGVAQDGYSLWGGSAGARMAATLGNESNLRQLTGRDDIPQASAVIMQYTGYSYVSADDAPTYACVGSRDGIASWQTMQSRLEQLSSLGIPTEFHVYDGLSHGFGLGTGTVAEGWIDDALSFWDAQR
jgi:enterochelin esterase-like enzyme/acetyl esterase/lipase